MIKLDTELKIKRADIWVKVFGVGLTIASLFFGLYQYMDNQAHENKMEFKRKVWQKQLETYSKSCELAGLIAINPDGPKADE